MNAFLMKPIVQKTLNVFFAYLLFALFALLGLVVLVNLHTAAFRISLMATTRIGVGNVVYVWGGFFMLGIYAVGIVVLEGVMNKAAKKGRILPVGVRIFAIEALLGLLGILAPIIAAWIFIP